MRHELVKRSHIIYSVIHFTSPCSECKLRQSFYFKPSFPSRGCRLPSLLSIRLTFLGRCPKGTVHLEIRSVCGSSCRFPRWPAALCFFRAPKKIQTMEPMFSCILCEDNKLDFSPQSSIFRPPWPSWGFFFSCLFIETTALLYELWSQIHYVLVLRFISWEEHN